MAAAHGGPRVVPLPRNGGISTCANPFPGNGFEEKVESIRQAYVAVDFVRFRERRVTMEVRVRVIPKKSKQGTYVQSVREHYLRSDLGCLSQACKICSASTAEATPFNPLSSPLTAQALSASAPHYVIPDAPTVLRFLEILEAPVITDVIVLQTVFAEVRLT